MVLDIQNVTHVFNGGGLSRFTALKDISFDVNIGDFICIIGKSGCGKSTLFNIITGILPPSAGKVLIEGVDLWALSEKEISFMRNARIGYVQQGAGLLQNLTALDNVRLPFYLTRRDGEDAGRARFLLEKVGLSGKGGRYPSQLSGGEQKKVAIARALMNAPMLLVADEPTADIDEESTHDIMRFFSTLKETGTTILIATHDMDIVPYASRVLKLKSGALFADERTAPG